MLNIVYEALVGILAFIPALVANPGAVIAGGKWRMDMGRNFIDGKRIFGDGKTFSGYAGGIAIGALAGFVSYTIMDHYSMFPFNPGYSYLLFASIILAWGSLTGDLLGSFLKRRLGMSKGQKGNIMDMWPFVIVAFLFSFIFTYPFFMSLYGDFIDIIIILILTPALHRSVNILAFRMKWKDVPW